MMADVSASGMHRSPELRLFEQCNHEILLAELAVSWDVLQSP